MGRGRARTFGTDISIEEARSERTGFSYTLASARSATKNPTASAPGPAWTTIAGGTSNTGTSAIPSPDLELGRQRLCFGFGVRVHHAQVARLARGAFGADQLLQAVERLAPGAQLGMRFDAPVAQRQHRLHLEQAAHQVLRPTDPPAL